MRAWTKVNTLAGKFFRRQKLVLSFLAGSRGRQRRRVVNLAAPGADPILPRGAIHDAALRRRGDRGGPRPRGLPGVVAAVPGLLRGPGEIGRARGPGRGLTASWPRSEGVDRRDGPPELNHRVTQGHPNGSLVIVVSGRVLASVDDGGLQAHAPVGSRITSEVSEGGDFDPPPGLGRDPFARDLPGRRHFARLAGDPDRNFDVAGRASRAFAQPVAELPETYAADGRAWAGLIIWLIVVSSVHHENDCPPVARRKWGGYRHD